MASHSTEFHLAEISSPVPARLSYQEVTACVQQPRLGLDGQRGLSWTLTLHAICNSPKSRMILLLTQVSWYVQTVRMCAYCTVLFARKGNPLGPMPICLGIYNLLASLSSEFIVFYLDNGTIGGSITDIEMDLRQIEDQGKALGGCS